MLLDTGLQIFRQGRIELPAEIGRTMLSLLQFLPNPGLEYGVFLQGEWDPEKATVKVRPDKVYFPKQEVTAASISFLEEPPGLEWNVIMHRHPAGVRRFSATDVNSINEEFLASILFIPTWEFPDAIINVPLAPGAKLQIPAAVEVQGLMFEVPDEMRRAVRERLTVLRPAARTQTASGQVLGKSSLGSGLGAKLNVGASEQVGRGTVTVVESDAPAPRRALGNALNRVRVGSAVEQMRMGDEMADHLMGGFHPDDMPDIVDAAADQLDLEELNELGVDADALGFRY